MCGYLLFFLFNIKIEKIRKIYVYFWAGRWPPLCVCRGWGMRGLFTWLSLVLFYGALVCPLSHEISLMRSGTELSQFLQIFLPTLISNVYSNHGPALT